MFKNANDLAAMKKEDQQYGEKGMKMVTAKNSVKRQKHRNEFKNMTSQDFYNMADDYDDGEE